MVRPSLPSRLPRSIVLPVSADPGDLVGLARAVLALPADRPTVLLIAEDGSVAGETALGPNIVIELFAHRPPRSIVAVGLTSPASVSRHGEGGEWASGVVHLVWRTGVSVTAVRADTGDLAVFGPDHEPQHGRVPDACRRLFDLPTPPPSISMTPFVFGAWLEVIGSRVDDEVLDWPTIVSWHPAAATLSGDPTPAEVATATLELGESMDWDRFRRVIAKVGGFPFGPDGITVAKRADAGMFSRWAMDELPLMVDALGRLARELEPVAHDRVWAAAHLCGAIVDGDE